MDGVTLTELLTGLLVLALVVAVAVPAHRRYVINVNRADARRDLVALADQLHRCFGRSADYRRGAATSADPCLRLPLSSAEGTYTVSFAKGEPTATTFRLVAQPQGAQAADTRCGALTLDERGTRGVTGSRPGQCWPLSGD